MTETCHDCDEPVYDAGFCYKHRRTPCPLKWCGSRSRGGRFCYAHRRQMREFLRVHCKVSNCASRIAARGYCQMHSLRLAKYGTVHTPNRSDKVPAAPLWKWIDAHGGMELVMQGWGSSSTERKNACKTVHRSRRQESVSIDVADNFCIHALGVHPYEVWGDAWWLPPSAWGEYEETG